VTMLPSMVSPMAGAADATAAGSDEGGAVEVVGGDAELDETAGASVVEVADTSVSAVTVAAVSVTARLVVDGVDVEAPAQATARTANGTSSSERRLMDPS